MAVFECRRHPEGKIRTSSGRLVRFRAGLAIVTDPELAAELRQVPAVHGVTEHNPPEPPADPRPPAPVTAEAIAAGAITPEAIAANEVTGQAIASAAGAAPTPPTREAPARPPQAAPKADWITYITAVTDLDAEQAGALSKAQLIKRADELGE
ncbi:hypothetical protein [Allonocardiopsis opalescens]|uniref:Uncharacterized protein n=1 Tax=Allonocardiopsis opalescens TaxID=1144618 RepID=A0A2T0PPJ9_9ACTN|nr:hypothetical protein [Allonocardiopsis opalescens]PRX90829.1 hypothetical protein CLV72_11625 [Allonocardiopsis opalescens]